ncbi:MAG: FUSC family protein [Ornithinimicrobium sp.]
MTRLGQRVLNAFPPARAIALGAVLLAIITVAALLIAWVAGPGLTLAFGMGVLGGTTAATAVTDRVLRVSTGLLLVAGAVGGSLTASSPWACAGVVLVVALLQAPLTAKAAGIAVFAPVIAAVFGSVDVDERPLVIGLGVAIGFVFVQLLSTAMRLPRTSATVPKGVAWRHATVFALLAAPAVLLTRTLEVGHGYWLVLTLAVVLQPSPRAARAVARARLTGTVTGVVVAIAMVVVLPGPVLMLATAACILLATAWGVCQNVEKQAHYGVLAILFLGSGGNLAKGVDLGIERLVLTAAAVALAVAAAAVLTRFELKN